MRILFFGAHFPRPNNPTIGTWALSQVTALRDAGHEVKVVSPVPAIPLFIAKILGRGTSAVCPAQHIWKDIKTDYVRWPVYPVGPFGKWLQRYPGVFVGFAWALSSRRFLRIAGEFAPDVVFGHHGLLGGFIASKVARKLSVPFFITEHNFNDIESCASSASRRRHYRQVTQGISSWIAVADRMRNGMLRIFPDVPAITIHNGAELIPHQLKTVPRPAALSGHVIILCVTFFYKRKNVPLLVESFDSIAARHPSALLVIGGSGDDHQAVAEAAQKAKHSSQVKLMGPMEHHEVLQHMLWCDVFALIGVNEPFGVVYSEAMMAGKPIIYAADGGVTDVVTDGAQGLSTLPGDGPSAADAMDKLLGDARLREQMGSAAAQLAHSRLTWAANAKNIGARFEAAVRNRHASTP